MMSRRMLLIFLLVTVIALAAFALPGSPLSQTAQPNGSIINLSAPGGYYNEPVTVTLETDLDGELYYTLDSTLPTRDSTRYTEPLTLYNQAEVRGEAVVLRACLFVGDAVIGAEVVATYFFGQSLDNLTMPLVSLVTDPVNLYDPDIGIYVGGRFQDIWMEENPDVIPDWTADANYRQRGPEWERDVHIEVYNTELVSLTSQSAGIRIAGGATANHPSKSLRIIGRDRYSGKLVLPLFANLTAYDNEPIAKFTNVVLRNAGNDDAYCYIRDALCQQLGLEAGLVATDYQPVCVYLNGKYHGILNARERMDTDFLVAHYGVADASIAILTDAENEPRLDSGTESDYGDFMQLLRWVESQDFTRDSAVAKLNKELDVDSLTSYYAFQILCGNIDWPHNNILLWRAAGGKTPYGDGRWRYALKDLDVALGQMNPYSWEDVLANAIHNSVLFRKLLTNANWKAQFVEKCETLLATVLHPDHIIAVANEMRLGIVSEMEYHLTLYERSQVTQDSYYAVLYDFIEKQPTYLAQCFEANLGVTLRLPTEAAQPLESKGSYPFPNNSIVLGGRLNELQTHVVDGQLCVPDGTWVPVEEYAAQQGLKAYIHEPTNSVIFSPPYDYPPR